MYYIERKPKNKKQGRPGNEAGGGGGGGGGGRGMDIKQNSPMVGKNRKHLRG